MTVDVPLNERRKTIWELIRVSLAVMGIEFTYSAITAFVSPILLEFGVNYNQMTLVWAISPIIGFFLSPIMGSLSDRCRFKMGRRRPFIILFSVFNVIGLLLIPFGQWLMTAVQNAFHFGSSTMGNLSEAMQQAVTDTQSSVRTLAIVVTIVGIVMTDYASDALQNPSRAYLLDVCRVDDHARGLTTFTILAGVGGFIGYMLGSIDWSNVQLFDYSVHNGIFGGHIQMLYTIIAILFTICIIASITTFKEVPLQLSECMSIDPDIATDNIIQKEIEEVAPIQLKQTSYGSIEENTNSVKNSPPSLTTYIKSVFFMPYSLRMLCLTNLFCWMAHSTYTLYFTDFVGNVVFGGQPNAEEGSEEKTLYENGVRFGCLGMAVYSLSCTCYSFAVESLVKRFSLRRIYMFNILLDSASLLLMSVIPTKIAVLVLSISCGIFYATLFTVPYILIAHYHGTNVFEIDSCGDVVPQKQVRGLGTDVSVVGSCVFLAQFLLSVIMTIVTQFYAAPSLVIVTGGILGICAFFSSFKVMYLDL